MLVFRFSLKQLLTEIQSFNQKASEVSRFSPNVNKTVLMIFNKRVNILNDHIKLEYKGEELEIVKNSSFRLQKQRKHYSLFESWQNTGEYDFQPSDDLLVAANGHVPSPCACCGSVNVSDLQCKQAPTKRPSQDLSSEQICFIKNLSITIGKNSKTQWQEASSY